MFVQFGISQEARRTGLIEDFCPICRTLQPHEALEITRLTQVYFITVDARGTGVFRARCSACRSEFNRNGNPLHRLESDDEFEDAELPRAEGAMQRARTELLIENNDLAPTFREAMLREPFDALSAMVQRQIRNSMLDVRAAVLVLSILLFIGVMAYMSLVYGTGAAPGHVLPWILLGYSFASILFLAALFVTTRRYSRRKLRPRLASALQPLQPSLEELQIVLHEFKAKKLAIGKIVTAEQLCGDIMALDALSLGGAVEVSGSQSQR